jgi:hypothetical protein
MKSDQRIFVTMKRADCIGCVSAAAALANVLFYLLPVPTFVTAVFIGIGSNVDGTGSSNVVVVVVGSGDRDAC